MCKQNTMYAFSYEEIDDILENYCVPVWEAPDTNTMARNGYVLACVLDYIVRQKEREFKE